MVRQRDPADRAACQAIRDGHAADALTDLHRRGRIHRATTPEAAIKEIVHAWNHHRASHGLDGVQILTDTSNRTVDTLNALCQAKRLAAGELSGPPVEIVDRATGRRERLHVGDQVRFIRAYQGPQTRVLNGTAGTVLTVDADPGLLTVACDDDRTVTLQPSRLENAQPLRLGYAGHVLKLQGGQAAVVLLLPGSWQTSRQSAYSMTTRCVEELHVFVDRQTQCTGLYLWWDPIDALADRWTRDARKLPASSHLDSIDEHREAHVGHLSVSAHAAVSWPVQDVSEPHVSRMWPGDQGQSLPPADSACRKTPLDDLGRDLELD